MGSEVPRNEPIAERMCVVRPSGRVPLCSRTKYQQAQSSIQITPLTAPTLSLPRGLVAPRRLLADGQQVPVDHHQPLDRGQRVLLHLGVRVLEDGHHRELRAELRHEAAPLGVVLDELADVVARDGEGLRVGLGHEEGDERLDRGAVLGLEGLVVVL